MPKISYCGYFLAFFLFFTSCQNPNGKTPLPSDKKAYFDLPQFFAEEAKSMEKGRNLSKEVVFNGKKSVSKVIISDWGRELNIFSRVDLNRSELLDKYHQEELINKLNGKLIQTRYTAKDSSLATKAVDIFYQDSVPHTVAIINNIQNGLFEQQQYLLYKKNELIEIVQLQKTYLWAENSYKIQLFLR